MSITTGIVLALLFVGLQGFFAASEMSLISQNRLRLHHLAERRDKKARMILGLLHNPERLLATTLVGQNIALITSSTLVNLLAYRVLTEYFSGHEVIQKYIPALSTAAVFPLIVIFGQIVPMSISRLNSFVLARWFVLPLRMMSYILFPLVVAFSKISGWIADLIGARGHPRNPFVSREELRLLFRDEDQMTTLDKEGRQMIHEVFDLQTTFAEDIMTPLIDVTAAPETSTLETVVNLINEKGYSHIPIYRGRIDEIIGVVHAPDLIGLGDLSRPVKDYISKPFIIPETKPAYEILMEFRQNNRHVAFAVDEYGGVTGLVTMEDILEEIVGEIEDEHDTEGELKFEREKDGVVIDGSMSLDEFNEQFGRKLGNEDVETVGGLILATLGRIPSPGEHVKVGEVDFEIRESTDRKVVRVSTKQLTSPGGGDRTDSR